MEAIAATYAELVKKYQLAGRQERMRFLDKVRMNMAYFQLGGLDDESPKASSLNIVIRRKLKEHLSLELRGDTRLFKSLDD